MQKLLKACPEGLVLHAMEHVLYAIGPDAQEILTVTDFSRDKDICTEHEKLRQCDDFITLGHIDDAGGW